MISTATSADSPPPPYHHTPSIPFPVGASKPTTSNAPQPAPSAPSDSGPTRIQAYARLEFMGGVDFYIRKLSVTIGRRPLGPSGPQESQVTIHDTSNDILPQPVMERSPLLRPVSDERTLPPVLDMNAKQTPSMPYNVEREIPLSCLTALSQGIDVDLGPIKAISRDHARLFYDYKSSNWTLDVRGRNGAVVDGQWHSRGEAIGMSHGTRIQIAERVFFFMLPLMAQSSSTEAGQHTDNSSSSRFSESSERPQRVKADRHRERARERGAPVGRGAPSRLVIKSPRASTVGSSRQLPESSSAGAYEALSDKSFGSSATRLLPFRFPESEHIGKTTKPPYTMTSIVAQAITYFDGERGKASQLCHWIKAAYPYFASDATLQSEVHKRLRDTRFFVPSRKDFYLVIKDTSQAQYFDGLVFRKRAPIAQKKTRMPACQNEDHAIMEHKNTTAPPLPIVIEPLPADYDPSGAPTVAGLVDSPIVIHSGRMILSPAVFGHLDRDAGKLERLRAMPTDKAIAALRQFVVAFLKAKANKAEKR